MTERLSIREMFALGGIEVSCNMPFPSHVASDSRDVRQGGAFVALEGERVDGHDYIGQAVENGAALIVGRKGRCPSGLSVPCVELDEPERELGELGSRYVEYAAPKEIVAVTGSVGKTTTREAIRCVLEKRFRVHAAERSFNTVIGCGATALAMPLGTEVLLLEFGANTMTEIRNLARLFPPTVALVTQVAPVHLAGFGSIEGVLKAKMDIAQSDRLRCFIYDGDNSLLRDSAARLPAGVQKFGVGWKDGEYRIADSAFRMREGMPCLSLKLEGPKGNASFQAGVWGEKLALPVAMAAVVGNVLGLSLEECAAALSAFSGLKGRGRILSLRGAKRTRFVVDDAYNANPVSMRSSLETFLSLATDGKKYAVLGDMRELGEAGLQYHKELVPLVAKLDGAIFIGDLWKEALLEEEVPPGGENDARHFVEKWQDAADILRMNRDWAGLLIKGSNSFCMEDLVRWVTDAPEYSNG